MLPSFVCIGAGRAGTSWLYEVLREHPEVCTARNVKETYFFDKNYHRGQVWYETFFADCREHRAIGEITNRYLFSAEVARRIHDMMPWCKIIVCLRNPFDRIQSVYMFKIREGAFSGSFAEALVAMPELIRENRYAALLKPWITLFGMEQMFFMIYDDLVSNPGALCRELFRFLDVDSEFEPATLHRKVNKALEPRFRFAPAVTKATARVLRRFGFYWLLTQAKRSDWVKGVLFKEFEYERANLLSDSLREQLVADLVPDIEELADIVGRPLDDWKRGPSGGSPGSRA